MVLKKKFQSKESAIAAYDYTDIASGEGVVQFMGMKVATGAATYDYIMTTNAGAYSSTYGWSALDGFNEDFDVTFNKPQTIKGDLYLNVPLALYVTGGTITALIDSTIIHYDGTTETTIGAKTLSPNEIIDTADTWLNPVISLKFGIANTHFKIGDTLRVNLSGSHSGGTAPQGRIGYSPVGNQASTTFVTTQRLNVFVPFRIDI